MPQTAKYILFSAEFKPLDGGLADYAYQFANYLHKKEGLKAVITFTQSGKFPYPVKVSKVGNIERKIGQRLGDKMGLTRKMNTLLHFFFLYLNAFFDLFLWRLKNVKFICVTAYDYRQLIFINSLKLLNIKYSIVLHGLEIIVNRKNHNNLFQKILKGSEQLIFNSDATGNLFKKSFPGIKKNHVIQYPVLDPRYINSLVLMSRQELEQIWEVSLQDKIIISSVTRLVKRKGLDIAIDIISKLIENFPNIIFVIGGKGEEYNSLLEQVKKLNLQKFVIFSGFISDVEKFSLLKESSIFLLPTRGLDNEDFEGFGISFIEASYMQNAVIGGTHGGVKESINDGLTGYTIDFDGKDCMGKSVAIIENLINRPVLLKSLQEAGKQFVINNYSQFNYSF